MHLKFAETVLQGSNKGVCYGHGYRSYLQTDRETHRYTKEYLYSIFYCIVHFGALKLVLIPFNVFEGATFFG
jgi:hypothetical protein